MRNDLWIALDSDQVRRFEIAPERFRPVEIGRPRKIEHDRIGRVIHQTFNCVPGGTPPLILLTVLVGDRVHAV
jgi:hypothetical protein